MWTISGPFEGPRDDLTSYPQRIKLLKTGKAYSLGRKSCPLLINHIRISSNHCQFVVGELTQDNLSQVDFVPTLEVFNNRPKTTMTVQREGELLVINPQTSMELKDGDTVNVISGAPIVVKWQRLCCYAQLQHGKTPISLVDCAQLGIHVVHSPQPEVSHYLTPSLDLTVSTATALLSAQIFVTPKWLAEIIRLGNLPKGRDASEGAALEDVFSLPPEASFRPPFSPALSNTLQDIRVWDANEARMSMLRGKRFVCVCTRGTEVDAEFHLLITAGGAECEGFAADSGVVRWRKVLSKGKSKVAGKTVLAADNEAVRRAIGQEKWDELLKEAKSSGLHVTSVATILKAVATVDISLIDTFTATDAAPVQESPLPDFIPNTYSEEPSNPSSSNSLPQSARSGPPRRLTRRTTPSAESRPPSPPRREPSLPPEASGPMSRKPLVRRARAAQQSTLIGIDDPSEVDIEPPHEESALKPPSTKAMVPPTPSRTSRLKRRAATAQPSSLFPELDEADEVAEPPHKKYKALFDASDPDRLLAESQLAESALALGDSSSGNPFLSSSASAPRSAGSQTQTQTLLTTRPVTRPPLTVVREEEEESVATTQRTAHTKKRNRQDGDEDVQMQGGEGTQTPTPAKRRAIANVNAVENVPQPRRAETAVPSSPRKGAGGSTAGEPDKDAAFLQALASRKRGKKAEDDFDREFNKLKISKPDIERDAREHEYEVLADFGDDSGLRGNFMTVVEMEVFKKDNGVAAGRLRGTERAEWEGRQNFKKFRKKAAGDRRAPIDLTVVEPEDDGTSPAHWGKPTYPMNMLQSERHSSTHSKASTPAPEQPKPGPRKKQRSLEEVNSEEEENVALMLASVPGRSAARSTPAPRAGSVIPAGRSQRSTRSAKKSQPLFLDSDDDEAGPTKNGALDEDASEDFGVAMDAISEGDEDEDEDSTTLPTRSSRSNNTQTRSRATPAPSQKLAVTKPKATAKAGFRSRKPPAVMDDDSDDGATFKGFVRTRSRR